MNAYRMPLLWERPAFEVLAHLRRTLARTVPAADPWANADPYMWTSDPWLPLSALHPDHLPTRPTTTEELEALWRGMSLSGETTTYETK